jgi:hypothetical protein
MENQDCENETPRPQKILICKILGVIPHCAQKEDGALHQIFGHTGK